MKRLLYYSDSAPFLISRASPKSSFSVNEKKNISFPCFSISYTTVQGSKRDEGTRRTWFQTEPRVAGAGLAARSAASSFRGAGSGAMSPVASRTQYLSDVAFSAAAAAAVAVSSISRARSGPDAAENRLCSFRQFGLGCSGRRKCRAASGEFASGPPRPLSPLS